VSRPERREPRTVYFAESLAAARRAGSGDREPLIASPRRPRALHTALSESLPVLAVVPAGRKAFWKRVARRFLLPAAPPLLHHAISGIARHEESEVHEGAEVRLGQTRADWIEGNLGDRRARSLLEDPDRSRLWIVEDFRRLKITGGMWRRLEKEKIAIAAYRPLRWRRQRPGRERGTRR
jgi:hypothetical protein